MCSRLSIFGKSLWKYWSIFEVEKISRIEKFIGMNLSGWKFRVSETLIGWNTGEQKYRLVQTLANPIFLWARNAWWPGIAMILIIFSKGKKGRFDFPWSAGLWLSNWLRVLEVFCHFKGQMVLRRAIFHSYYFQSRSRIRTVNLEIRISDICAFRNTSAFPL